MVNSFGTPYDAISIMHYISYIFANSGRAIESKYGIPLGGSELSPIDILQTRRMYQCPPGMTAEYGVCIIECSSQCASCCRPKE